MRFLIPFAVCLSLASAVDAQRGPARPPLVREGATAKLANGNQIYLASTHFHVEHTTGLAAFPATARYINATVQEDDYTLDLGGVRVRFLVLGPTHTRGDTAFYVEGDNVLFAGDLVMNHSFVAANQDSSLPAWLAAFDVLDTLGPRVVVPTHGPIGDGALIGVNRGFMQAIDGRPRQLKAEGRTVDEVAKTVDEVAKTVQAELQAKHPTFERLNGVAGAARAA